MSKLKWKKASRAMRRGGTGIATAAGTVATIVSAIVAVAELMERVRSARRRPPGERERGRRDPGAGG